MGGGTEFAGWNCLGTRDLTFTLRRLIKSNRKLKRGLNKGINVSFNFT